MVYIILICLYTYLIVRLLLSITPKGKDITKKLGPKISIIEIFIIAIVVSYLFSYYFFQESQFENFIVPASLIWIGFTSSVLLLGIGIGVRFILDLMSSFINEKDKTPFTRNKEVYEVFSQVWVNISVLVIFFNYALMEISKPVARLSGIREMGLVYALSFILGFLYFFLHKNIHFFVRKVTIVSMIVISLCISLFIYESKIDFLSILPVTSSFIFFNISFFTTLLFAKKYYPNEFIELEETMEPEVKSKESIAKPKSKKEVKPKTDLILNFGNTTIFSSSQSQAIKISKPELLQQHKRDAVEKKDSQRESKKEESRPRFSLNDWKL